MKNELTLNEMIKKLMESFSGTEILPQSHTTEKQKQDAKTYGEMRSDFLKDLDVQKKEEFDFLESMANAIASADVDVAILLGMQLKTSIDEIIRDPVRYINERDYEDCDEE